MKVKEGSCIILLWMFLPFGLSEISCGNLTVEYVTGETSINCKIQLHPSSYMRTYIMDSHLYRWILTQDSQPRVILQKNAGTYDTVKYGEDNYTLLIRHLSKSDEGRYRVHCWAEKNHFFSPEVMVNIPEVIPTTAVLPASPQSPVANTGIGTTALVVIAVCALLVVAIIVGTTFLIMQRRHSGQGQEGTKQLVSEDDISGNTPNLKKEESVYSEIDTNKMTTDYAKVNKKTSAAPASTHPRKNPSKPKGSENKSVAESENEYDLVKHTNIRSLPPRPENKIAVGSENEYAVVKDTDAIAKGSSSGYEVACLQLQENEEENSSKDFLKEQIDKDLSDIPLAVTDDEQERKPIVKEQTYNKADGISESNVKDIDGTHFPMYAKVIKQKPADNITKDNYAGGTEYNIKFPAINCSDITKMLGDNVQRQGASRFGELVTYSNLVSRPQRVKSKRGRLSRRSLQYAVLDLAKDENVTSGNRLYSEVLLPAVQPCQYASIDFEKRAFVAPIRKAPSSWYKRRNKKGKRK